MSIEPYDQYLTVVAMELPVYRRCTPMSVFFTCSNNRIPEWVLDESDWIPTTFRYPVYNNARRKWLSSETDMLAVFHPNDIRLTPQEAEVNRADILKYLQIHGLFEVFYVYSRYTDDGRSICFVVDDEYVPRGLDIFKWTVETFSAPATVPMKAHEEDLHPTTRLELNTRQKVLNYFFPLDTWLRITAEQAKDYERF